MTPGRELDAELAQLLGLPVVWSSPPYVDVTRPVVEGRFPYLKGSRDGCEYDWADVLRYSTDWHAMGLLIEELQGRGLYADITTYADFFEVLIRKSDGSVVSDATVSQLPHAVALAARSALKGVGA